MEEFFRTPVTHSTLVRNADAFAQFAIMVVRLQLTENKFFAMVIPPDIEGLALNILRICSMEEESDDKDALMDTIHDLAFGLVSLKVTAHRTTPLTSPIERFMALFSRTPDGSSWLYVGSISSQASRVQWAIRAVVAHHAYVEFQKNEGADYGE